jgi:hypothetical protein
MNITPLSTDVQGWRDGIESRQALRDSGFSPADYTVRRIKKTVGEPFVIQHHYSHSEVCTIRAIGLHRGAELVGVALFSNAYPAVIHNLWGWPTPLDSHGNPRPYRGQNWLQPGLPILGQEDRHGSPLIVRGGAVELGRLVLLDEVPGRAETWFLGECFRLLAADGFWGVVSFADPFPRYRDDGTVLFPGHVGWIYQAHNAVFTGRGTEGKLELLPDRTSINARSSVKVRKLGKETGGNNQIARLVSWGASPPRAGENIKSWLKQAKLDIGVITIEHPGNFRYAWTIGTRRERHNLPVLTPAQAYPKSVDGTVSDAFLDFDLEIA